jgi:hypothetical protein
MLEWLASTASVKLTAQAPDSRIAATANLQEGFIQACLTGNLAVVRSLVKSFGLTAHHMNRALWLCPFVAISSTTLITALINEYSILDGDSDLGPELYARAIAGKHHAVCDLLNRSGFRAPTLPLEDEEGDEDGEDEGWASNAAARALPGNVAASPRPNEDPTGDRARPLSQPARPSTLLRKLSLNSLMAGASTHRSRSATRMLARGRSSMDSNNARRSGGNKGSFTVMAMRRNSSQLLALSLLSEVGEELEPGQEVAYRASPTAAEGSTPSEPPTVSKRMSQSVLEASTFLEMSFGVSKRSSSSAGAAGELAACRITQHGGAAICAAMM